MIADRACPAPSAARRTNDYFLALLDAAARAAGREGRDAQRQLARRTLRFRTGGARLHTILQGALDHLPGADAGEADLTVHAWDEAATGVSLPPAPWAWPARDQAVELTLPPGADDFRPLYEPANGVFGLYQESTRTAAIWIADAGRLPTPWHGAPLFRVLHWWSHSAGLALLHAGCVGTEHGAVLLAGKGGSGKSTTSLLCLAAGMRYVSDDYCLLEPGTPPVAHCLFNTGKLHRDHLRRFPALAAVAVEAADDAHQKRVIFGHRHFPAQLAPALPLRAVVLPRICGGPAHRLVPIPAAEALRGLAPSTLLQLSGHGARHLQAMAGLVRQVDCFRLELSEDYAALPGVIASLLSRGAAAPRS